ncbi:DUF4912 domain-containing protein [Prochlorococcus sp. MIT 0801]|uniref:DUF4912 domain-containing protein n=1 Tax=Prochlorococcus sp. MIT 0801 TaxID=1501269 RepID=UPI0004F64F2A|nr:DUF4912 domain-containing protein [Prochlorococcus sp. MIT 0801]AIQ96213.1 hypothetical protein EW15_0121 [Prochlorococcus sp. MIT 0801]
MKISRNLILKQYIWSGLHKLTNSFSILKVNNLGNGYVKCIWEIDKIDNFRIEFSNSCFCAIRLFDISNNRRRNDSTCIMKEIEISKYQSSITFPIPVNKGVYYFEFGYRKKDGSWRKLAYQKLNLGYRIKKIQNLDNDNWFDSIIRNNELGLHEKAYQISLNTAIGGSEKVFKE